MSEKKILILFPFAPNKFRRFYQVCETNHWKITAAVAKGQRFNHEEFRCDFVEFSEIEENVDVVYQMVKDFGPFDAVIPFSEFSVVLAESLSARFGLAHNPVNDPRVYRWKNLMRRMLSEAGCQQPDILAAISADAPIDINLFEDLNFPVIVKPADAAGSLNVKICNTPEEVFKSIVQIRNFLVWEDIKMGFSGLALVESYVPGQEYSSELIVQEGKIIFRNDTMKFVSSPPYRDEVAHLLPAPMSTELKDAVGDMLSKIVNGSRFKNGVIHAEYKVHDGTPFVIEVAFRIPGDRISDLIEMHYDVSLEEALIRTRMGEKALSKQPKICHRKYTGVKFQFPSYHSLKKPESVSYVVQGERWVSLSELPSARNETSLPNRVGFSVLQSDHFEDLKAFLGMSVSIRFLRPEETWPLRHKILRPHQSLEDCVYPNDHDERSIHIGAFMEGELIGVASVFCEPRNGNPSSKEYRLRGMAVRKDLQSQGVGSIILKSMQEEVTSRGASIIWCNARTSASFFYTKHGFVRKGDEYDLPGLGPHYLLEWVANQ